MKIKIECTSKEYAWIMKHSRRLKCTDDLFEAVRHQMCLSVANNKCMKYESCRECILNNINWRVIK